MKDEHTGEDDDDDDGVDVGADANEDELLGRSQHVNHLFEPTSERYSVWLKLKSLNTFVLDLNGPACNDDNLHDKLFFHDAPAANRWSGVLAIITH